MIVLLPEKFCGQYHIFGYLKVGKSVFGLKGYERSMYKLPVWCILKVDKIKSRYEFKFSVSLYIYLYHLIVQLGSIIFNKWLCHVIGSQIFGISSSNSMLGAYSCLAILYYLYLFEVFLPQNAVYVWVYIYINIFK